MSREQGTFNASYSLEPNIEWTLDARQLVDTVADLVLESTWNRGKGVFLPEGFFTSVRNDPDETKNGIYRLKNINYQMPDNWEKIGSGDGSGGDTFIQIPAIPAYVIEKEVGDKSSSFSNYRVGAYVYGNKNYSVYTTNTINPDTGKYGKKFAINIYDFVENITLSYNSAIYEAGSPDTNSFVVFVYNEYLYALGDMSNVDEGVFWRINLNSLQNNFTLEYLSGAPKFSKPIATIYNNKLHIFAALKKENSSSTSAPITNFYTYDFNTQSWEESITSIPTEIVYETKYGKYIYDIVDDNVYLFGCFDDNILLKSIIKINLLNYETTITPLEINMTSGDSMMYLENNLFLLGLRDNSIKYFYSYNMITNEFIEVVNSTYEIYIETADVYKIDDVIYYVLSGDNKFDKMTVNIGKNIASVKTGDRCISNAILIDSNNITYPMNEEFRINQNGKLVIYAKSIDFLNIVRPGSTEPDPSTAVLYTPQVLNDEQKTQARNNIGINSVIEEAPNDGKQYGRKNKTWSEIVPTDNTIYLDLIQIVSLNNNSTPEEINNAFLSIGGVDAFRLDIINNNKTYVLREVGEVPDYKADTFLTDIYANDFSIQMSYSYSFNDVGNMNIISNALRLENIGEGWTCNLSTTTIPNDLVKKISLDYIGINALSNISTSGEINSAFNGDFNNFITSISNNNTIVVFESEYQPIEGKKSQTILSIDWSISGGSSPNILTLVFYSNDMKYLINIKIIQDPSDPIRCERIDIALDDEEYRFRVDLLNEITSGASSESIIAALGGPESYIAFRDAMVNTRTPLLYLCEDSEHYETFIPASYIYIPAERSVELNYIYRGKYYRIKLRLQTDTVAEFAMKVISDMLIKPAANVTFDKTNTKMTSSSVQTAIEELHSTFGKTFIGTQAEFEAMPEIEQQEYDTLIFVLP